MLKKFIPFLLLTQLAITPLMAQRNCSSHDHMVEMLQNDPEFAQRRQQIENHSADYVANPSKQVRVLKTIPVVVHVVYNTAAQNISTAQIQSQINVLNQDFRKLNADISSVPSAFTGLAADCEIEFCLAQRTPSGAATTGIVRVQTSTTSFSSNNNVKFASSGGSNAWDATKYLNIWVAPLSGGLLGYAQFPGGSAATDGVVCNHSAFGTTGTAAAPFNKGRTATHEVGHWLNLFHIWGDDGTSCSGSDQVNDTPNQADQNYGCPSFPAVSCSNGPNGDMFMNYMDYTDDACMFMFTNGQKARMNALFATGGSKASLLTSLGCVPPATSVCGVASGLNATAITTTSATLNWGAVTNATSYNVQYKLSSASTWTTITSTSASLPITGLTAGSIYQFQVQTVCATGTSAYSTAASFTTTSVAPSCTNSYESNNSLGAAKVIPINTPINSLIATNGDRDYYRFTTLNGAAKIKVTLTNLPADYDMRLYNLSGTQLGSSSNTGTASESITYNTATLGAQYYLQVFGYNGAFNATQCYTLTVQTSASNLRMEAITGLQKEDLTISPNPASEKINIEYNGFEGEKSIINIYSPLGQKVATQTQNNLNGLNNMSFNLSQYSNGIYLVEMITDSERFVKRISILK